MSLVLDPLVPQTCLVPSGRSRLAHAPMPQKAVSLGMAKVVTTPPDRVDDWSGWRYDPDSQVCVSDAGPVVDQPSARTQITSTYETTHDHQRFTDQHPDYD